MAAFMAVRQTDKGAREPGEIMHLRHARAEHFAELTTGKFIQAVIGFTVRRTSLTSSVWTGLPETNGCDLLKARISAEETKT